MPRYRVELVETAVYDVEVEADNEDEAAELAETRFVEEGCAAFPVAITERDAGDIEELT
jgi:DNA-binding sugar fermentation-stimulating protein